MTNPDPPTNPVEPVPGETPSAIPPAPGAGATPDAPAPTGGSGWDAGGAAAAPGSAPAGDPEPGYAPPPPAGGTAPGYASTSPTGGAAPGYAAPGPAGGQPSWSPSWPDRAESGSPGLVIGIVLVVVGAIFLVLRVGDIALGPDAWPLWLIVPGLAMVAGSLFIPSRGGLGLAVPGAILAIVGAILWVQQAYSLYSTWAYAWALVVPTGPGLAMVLYGTLHRDGGLARDGLRTTLTGLGLFLGFGLFFEGVIGLSGHRIEHLDQVLPYVAIGLGGLLIVLALLDGGRRDPWREQRRAERQAARARRREEKAARRAAR